MDLFDDLPEPVHGGVDQQQQKGDCMKRSCVSENEEQKTKRSRPQQAVKLKAYHCACKGEREEMEDAHLVIDQFNLLLTTSPNNSIIEQSAFSFYAVFDGHAGAKASNYAAAHLHLNFASAFKKAFELGSSLNVEKEISKVFVEAFRKTDEDFLKEAAKQKPAWKDGSTALAIVAVDDVIYIANLGDSKAVLCRYNEEQKKHVAVTLSKEHNPVCYEERMRIQKMGGHVREGRVMGVLEVSRSIGDGQYKTLGVTCIPQVTRLQLTENDRFVVMACDGLWKVFSASASVDFVLKEAVACGEGGEGGEGRLESAASKLSSEAVRRGSGDNVTVIIIHITHH